MKIFLSNVELKQEASTCFTVTGSRFYDFATTDFCDMTTKATDPAGATFTEGLGDPDLCTKASGEHSRKTHFPKTLNFKHEPSLTRSFARLATRP